MAVNTQEVTMATLHTIYGSIHGATRAEYHSNGALRSCTAGEASPLATPWGVLIPQYTAAEVRRRQLPTIEFHDNGLLKSLPLEAQTMIQTPAGTMPAELVTFHETGALRRVFPLNGTLNGYWTQENEDALAMPVAMDTPLGRLEVPVVGVHFGTTGLMRSITLWPGTRLDVNTPAGRIPVRNGIAFHANGAIESVEPDMPVEIETPIGTIHAFNPDAVGICGDRNSLCFDAEGNIVHVATAMDCVQVILPDGRRVQHAPAVRESYCEEAANETVPMTFSFMKNRLQVCAGEVFEYSMGTCLFSIKRTLGGFTLPRFVCSL